MTARLLAGPPLAAGAEALDDHRRRLGPPPDAATALAEIEAAGLLGRGGAGFPVGRKWRTVAERSRGRAVVLANGAEGEPASAKDRTLMAARPHLVLDGAVLAATVVGAPEVVLYIGEVHTHARAAMERAVAERRREARTRIRLVTAPRGYTSGEESAAVHMVDAGDARPTTTPPRPFERGVRGRPTLVQNVESLAQAALVARYGADWYRAAGRGETRGTALVTLSGAVRTPGVYEIEMGATVGEVVDLAQGLSADADAVLLGGYFGAFVDAGPGWDLALDPAAMRRDRLGFGCGVVSVMPHGTCGVAATARIMSYMAESSAGQCGPCVFGLRAIADATQRLAVGRAHPEDVDRLRRWTSSVRGRGACRHPDGAVGLLDTALDVFAEEFEQHRRHRRCSFRTAAGAA